MRPDVTFRVLDGGVATELTRQGLGDDLWSARVRLEAPEAIERVHAEYFRAGADLLACETIPSPSSWS